MKNSAEKLLSVCDVLIEMKEAGLDMDAVMQQLISVRDTIAEVLQDTHPDDDAEATKKLKAGYEHLLNSIAALESAKVK